MIPEPLMLSEVANRLEAIRLSYGFSDELFFRSVLCTPSAIRWFILWSDIRFRIDHQNQTAHERYAILLVLLERLLHNGSPTQEEHLAHIAQATVNAHRIASEFALIDFALQDQKGRGTFYNPNRVLRHIEVLLFSAAHGAIGPGHWPAILYDVHSRLFDYDERPKGIEPLYCVPNVSSTEPNRFLIDYNTGSWSPDPTILGYLRASYFAAHLDGLKRCPDTTTIMRVASLMYYAAEVSFKHGNPWYTPPRLITGDVDGLRGTLSFQEAGLAALEAFTDLSADVLMADYNYPGRGSPLNVLQTKSVKASAQCGLQELPVLLEWIRSET